MSIICKIDGCDKEATYKGQQVCQMHYFRFMRNGTYEKVRKPRSERVTHSAGYISLYKPEHKLSCKKGYVYEHRFVLFEKYGESLSECEICGKPWSWDDIYNSHVDHIDEDKSNNDESNLRPLCNSCNTGRSENSGRFKRVR